MNKIDSIISQKLNKIESALEKVFRYSNARIIKSNLSPKEETIVKGIVIKFLDIYEKILESNDGKPLEENSGLFKKYHRAFERWLNEIEKKYGGSVDYKSIVDNISSLLKERNKEAYDLFKKFSTKPADPAETKQIDNSFFKDSDSESNTNDKSVVKDDKDSDSFFKLSSIFGNRSRKSNKKNFHNRKKSSSRKSFIFNLFKIDNELGKNSGGDDNFLSEDELNILLSGDSSRCVVYGNVFKYSQNEGGEQENKNDFINVVSKSVAYIFYKNLFGDINIFNPEEKRDDLAKKFNISSYNSFSLTSSPPNLVKDRSKDSSSEIDRSDPENFNFLISISGTDFIISPLSQRDDVLSRYKDYFDKVFSEFTANQRGFNLKQLKESSLLSGYVIYVFLNFYYRNLTFRANFSEGYINSLVNDLRVVNNNLSVLRSFPVGQLNTFRKHFLQKYTNFVNNVFRRKDTNLYNYCYNYAKSFLYNLINEAKRSVKSSYNYKFWKEDDNSLRDILFRTIAQIKSSNNQVKQVNVLNFISSLVPDNEKDLGEMGKSTLLGDFIEKITNYLLKSIYLKIIPVISDYSVNIFLRIYADNFLNIFKDILGKLENKISFKPGSLIAIQEIASKLNNDDIVYGKLKKIIIDQYVENRNKNEIFNNILNTAVDDYNDNFLTHVNNFLNVFYLIPSLKEKSENINNSILSEKSDERLKNEKLQRLYDLINNQDNNDIDKVLENMVQQYIRSLNDKFTNINNEISNLINNLSNINLNVNFAKSYYLNKRYGDYSLSDSELYNNLVSEVYTHVYNKFYNLVSNLSGEFDFDEVLSIVVNRNRYPIIYANVKNLLLRELFSSQNEDSLKDIASEEEKEELVDYIMDVSNKTYDESKEVVDEIVDKTNEKFIGIIENLTKEILKNKYLTEESIEKLRKNIEKNVESEDLDKENNKSNNENKKNLDSVNDKEKVAYIFKEIFSEIIDNNIGLDELRESLRDVDFSVKLSRVLIDRFKDYGIRISAPKLEILTDGTIKIDYNTIDSENEKSSEENVNLDNDEGDDVSYLFDKNENTTKAEDVGLDTESILENVENSSNEKDDNKSKDLNLKDLEDKDFEDIIGEDMIGSEGDELYKYTGDNENEMLFDKESEGDEKENEDNVVRNNDLEKNEDIDNVGKGKSSKGTDSSFLDVVRNYDWE